MALSEILLVVAALAYLVCGVGIVKVLNAPEAVAPAWLAHRGLRGLCRARRGRSDEHVCARGDSLRFRHGCLGAAVHLGGDRVWSKAWCTASTV